MIILRPMQADEFPAYSEYFIRDYSEELAANYGHAIDDAVELARQDLSRYLPEGPATAGHDLLCIETSINQIPALAGYLWHAVNESEKSTFVYDFCVIEKYRNQGIGTEAISAFELQLLEQGIKQIKFRVAYHNKKALKLYESAGFSITGYNMSKLLGD